LLPICNNITNFFQELEHYKVLLNQLQVCINNNWHKLEEQLHELFFNINKNITKCFQELEHYKVLPNQLQVCINNNWHKLKEQLQELFFNINNNITKYFQELYHYKMQPRVRALQNSSKSQSITKSYIITL
jgi:hypothetical protein